MEGDDASRENIYDKKRWSAAGTGWSAMENWVIFSKSAILAYYVCRLIRGDIRDATDLVLLMLFYIVANAAFYITQKANLKKTFAMISLLVLAVGFVQVDHLMGLLLPLCFSDLSGSFKSNMGWAALAAAGCSLLLRGTLWDLYLITAAFSLMVYVLSSRSERRISALILEKDELRERVDALSGRADKDQEYQRQAQYSSQLEERNKVAQEIHDKVGHVLAGSLMQLEAAKLFVTKDPVKSGEILDQVVRVLREGMESIRVTLRNIRPAAEQLGINRVKLQLEEFSLNCPIRTSLIHRGDLDRISPLQWRVIQANVHEALTNMLKYASATESAVTVEVYRKFIKTEIRDNGKGATAIKKGLGISGMEERAGNLGGQVIVDGTKGFSVITILPLEEEVS